MRFLLNGEIREVEVRPDRLLLHLLREDLGLTGTKEGCGEGDCGACTVLMDGRPVYACLVLAAEVEGHEVLTVEGLAAAGGLHPLQQAFLEAGAVQCGFCTPGMLLSTKALLDADPRPDRPAILRALGGNLCRCTGYTRIFRAIEIYIASREGGGEDAVGR
ncbi:MAG: (2Fe-2S)-binding protein [Peptococcaceae bacterium]|nr:(2Fe-2S)-binding protein [Peptococcaceae bacterium]